MAIYLYSAFGLGIQSEIELPELVALRELAEPDVTISKAQIDRSDRALPDKGRDVVVTTEGIALSWSRVGSFLVSDGNTIIIDPIEGISDEIVRLPLLGMVLGALLHQRGYFTLHASAVAIGEKAVAFVGQKGAGKSTITAALRARGHSMLTDDILALDLQNDDSDLIQVIPGFPQIKLWPEASIAVGEDPELFGRLHPELEKRSVRSHGNFHQEKLLLSRIYTLYTGEEVASTPLSHKDSFLEILTHSYAARFLGAAGAGQAHFRQCTRLVESIPVYRLSRPVDLSLLKSCAELVERGLSDGDDSGI